MYTNLKKIKFMYKIDRRGGGVQKSFNRKLPNPECTWHNDEFQM